MDLNKQDLVQYYKKVIKCAVCKRYYGSDIKAKYETGLCRPCEGKVRRGDIQIKRRTRINVLKPSNRLKRALNRRNSEKNEN